jgi:hypothetical protein
VRKPESRTVALQESVTLALSLILAEMFYKFHSFSLECLAILATWMALSGIVDLATRLMNRRRE